MQFSIGDAVQLNSGGPVMTVNAIGNDGLIECKWFDEKKILQSGEFDQRILSKSSDGYGFA
jgi:uncharacterized protein YodC (DUF2158 family)